MENKIIQIASYGWDNKTSAEHFAKDAITSVEISLIRPTVNTPGLLHKNRIESTHISIFPNGIAHDVIIKLNILDCLEWMDRSILEDLNRSLYHRPVVCSFCTQ
jgi:hypothetical protein